MQETWTEIKCTVKTCPLHGLAFFLSQFGYCLLVWLFHSRGKNNKINRLQERC